MLTSGNQYLLSKSVAFQLSARRISRTDKQGVHKTLYFSAAIVRPHATRLYLCSYTDRRAMAAAG